jgi:hypothetical protein
LLSSQSPIAFNETIHVQNWNDWAFTIPQDSKVDFRVQAVNGTEFISSWGANYPYIIGQGSPLSDIQTITIANGATSISTATAEPPIPTSAPTSTLTVSPTPTVPELSWLVIMPLLVSALAVALLFKRRGTV